MELHEIEEKMLDAVQKFGHFGLRHANFKALSWELQRNEKNLVAVLMKHSEAKTTSAQEREAYASKDYLEHVRKTADMIHKESESLHKRDYYYALYEAMRSLLSVQKKMWEAT